AERAHGAAAANGEHAQRPARLAQRQVGGRLKLRPDPGGVRGASRRLHVVFEDGRGGLAQAAQQRVVFERRQGGVVGGGVARIGQHGRGAGLVVGLEGDDGGVLGGQGRGQ